MLRTVLAFSALTVFVIARLIRAGFGAWALWVIAGPIVSLLALLALLPRWSLPIRIGILIGAGSLLHWPWIAALMLAAPRMFLMIPGYLSTLIAGIRHPRPLWRQRPAVGA